MVEIKDVMVESCDCSTSCAGAVDRTTGEDILRQCVCGNSSSRTNCKCASKSSIKYDAVCGEAKGT